MKGSSQYALTAILLLALWLPVMSQDSSRQKKDSSILLGKDTSMLIDQKIVTLKEVVVRSNMDVPSFIRRIQFDTSFYRAFKNLRELNYTALNDIHMYDRKGRESASLQSRTRQTFSNGCRSMQVIEEKAGGDIRDKKGNWNYTTAEMYAGLFFTAGQICGEDNSVKAADLNTKGKRGMEKHKEQLKMLFFNPGKKIPGIPFIGDKINIYDPPQSDRYDFEIDMAPYQGQNAYVFKIAPRADLSRSDKNDIVINNVTTYFDQKDMRILARTYDLSYDAGVYEFDVQMEVQMGKVGELLIPTLIRYTGNWKVALKKKETGIFTATIFEASN